MLGVLESGGLRIHYEMAGSGVPLLLLNGLTRPVQTWRRFLKASPGRSTLAIDAPGVGRSSSPTAPVSIPAQARLVAEVLDSLELDAVDVLGYSHGGLVAQQLAADLGNQVSRLVLVATSCGVGAAPARSGWSGLATGTWPDSTPFGTSVSELNVFLGQMLAVSTWSSIPFLGSIQAATLVVHGSRDEVSPPENGALLARRIPGAQLHVLSAGHDMQNDGNAPLLARVVAEFLGPATPDLLEGRTEPARDI